TTLPFRPEARPSTETAILSSLLLAGDATPHSNEKERRFGLRSVAEEPHLFAPLAREEVDPVDEPHPVAPRAHEERMRPRAVGEEADAAQEVAVRDAGRGDDHLSRSEILGAKDALVVLDPGRSQFLDLPARRRPELGLQLAAEAPQRGGGQYGLPGAADADRGGGVGA